LRKHCNDSLWVVFGCGGNRDKGKRPQMGKIAEHWADHVVITDDNPRYENGLDIVNEILTGCHSEKIEVIQDRERAIQKVVANAAKNDCIVIAGKGHELYQESNGDCTPFSDKQVVIEALQRRNA
jgi:UDP-N-acetylmuramoyl-L-alanyl-D-glutamate--2,6-diaminopimelate ligase